MEHAVEVGVAKRRRGNGARRNGGNGGSPENGGTRRRTVREIVESIERRVLVLENGVIDLRSRVERIEGN